MKYEEIVNRYTPYLLTLSFLIVQDKQVSEQIVEDVFRKYYKKNGNQNTDQKDKLVLTTMVVHKCRDFVNSWNYRKRQFSQFMKKEQITDAGKYGEATAIILSLPLAVRSVAVLQYYGQFNTNETATMLRISPATVKKHFKKAQLAFRLQFSESELDRLSFILERENKIWNESLNEMQNKLSNFASTKESKKKLFNWKMGISAIFSMALLLGVFIFFKPEKTEELSTSINTEQPIPILATEELRVPSELTYTIAYFENYYLDGRFYSEQLAKEIAKSEVLDRFSYFYYLDQHNIVVNDERKEYYKRRAKEDLNWKKTDPFFMLYFEKLQQDLQITEEDYMTHFLMVNVEYRDLMDRFYQDVKSNVYDRIKKEYFALVGYPQEQLAETSLLYYSENYNEGVEQNPADLPFELPYEKVVKNEQGELLLYDPSYFYLGNSKYEKLVLKLSGLEYYGEFNRVMLQYFLTTLSMYQTEDLEEAQLAKELYELLLVLERSIENKLS